MNHTYKVADHAFTISVADDLPAWLELEPRFRPFASCSGAIPTLSINIKRAPLPVCEAESIYEPDHAGIGFIISQASRMTDGSLVLVFMHISEQTPRLWMKIPPQLDRADMVLTPDGDDNDSYFLTHAIMIAFLLSTIGNGTLLIHSSVVVYGGKGYLFQGKSGTGKSTHAALWTHNIEGAELLNDDHPVIRFDADGRAIVYGSPWSGKTHCYRNASAPIGAFVRIVRAVENKLHRLSPLRAYASLTSSVFFLPFMNDKLRDIRHKTIERLAATVPCCEMHCRPDPAAALTCKRSLQ